jgi:hypothetical protein
MANMKRNRIRSGKPAKRGEIFKIMAGKLFPLGMSSPELAASHKTRADANIYYEEMRPLLLLLRMLGLLPYRVTSGGKSLPLS